MPNYNASEVERISLEVEEEYKKAIGSLALIIGRLNQFDIEYNQQINCIEDFYELLFTEKNNVLGKNLEDSRRLLRHIITTFTNNIRNTLLSCRNANNLALMDDISGLSNQRAGRLYITSLIEEYSQNYKGFSIKLAERIRETVQNQTLNCIYPTTISIGVSHYPGDGNSTD